MSSRKPTLALTTPTTASFPAEALKSAASVRTPHSAIHASWREAAGLPSAGLPSAGLLSAGLPSSGLSSAGLQSPIVAIKTEEGLIKTPISPPVAYMDFLKMHSPITPGPSSSLPPAPTTQPAAAARPRMLHRASISGPVKTASSAAASSTSSVSSSSDEDSTGVENSAGDDDDDDDALDSGPSTAASSTSTASASDCSAPCSCQHERTRKSPKIARIDTSIPASPLGSAAAAANRHSFPMSAPAVGRTTFPSLKMPPSSPAAAAAAAARSNYHHHPPSQVNSPIRTPFSAKSTMASPFDWESALKARYAEFASPKAPSSAACCAKCSKPPSTTPATAPIVTADNAATSATTATAPASSKASSIRHIREVVTRTVTYTPRMQAAPKGKKRKIECDEH